MGPTHWKIAHIWVIDIRNPIHKQTRLLCYTYLLSHEYDFQTYSVENRFLNEIKHIGIRILKKLQNEQ